MSNQDEQGGHHAAPGVNDQQVEYALALILAGVAGLTAHDDTPIDEVYHLLADSLAGGLLAAQEMISWRWQRRNT